jgi:hypothetical protein
VYLHRLEFVNELVTAASTTDAKGLGVEFGGKLEHGVPLGQRPTMQCLRSAGDGDHHVLRLSRMGVRVGEHCGDDTLPRVWRPPRALASFEPRSRRIAVRPILSRKCASSRDRQRPIEVRRGDCYLPSSPVWLVHPGRPPPDAAHCDFFPRNPSTPRSSGPGLLAVRARPSSHGRLILPPGPSAVAG